VLGSAVIDYFALGLAVRDQHLKCFRRFSCINAVAALVDVAEVLGGHVSPLSVRAAIFNPRDTAAVGDLRDPEAIQRLCDAARIGNFDIGLGFAGREPGSWGGHLVGLVEDSQPGRSMVVDVTLEQANQPERGIVLKPVFMAAPSHIAGARFPVVNIAGCAILYQAFTDDTSFQSTGAWSNQEQRRMLRDAVLRQLEREPAGGGR
jgi:hypothetical protein